MLLKSMTMDLEKKNYTEESYKEYILGSAEVVGLMCLRVFTERNNELYNELKPFAMALGSAFQKINFLRDLNADYTGLGRMYFPNVDLSQLDEKVKKEIEADIRIDFDKGLNGIKKLPKKPVLVCMLLIFIIEPYLTKSAELSQNIFLKRGFVFPIPKRYFCSRAVI